MTRLLFMGSPEIAVPSLNALVQAGHEVLAVVTQPDKPKGRGQHMAAPAVKLAAQELQLPILQPTSVKGEEILKTLKAYEADAIAVVAYGKILPKSILQLTPMGCINVHFSLLPKYRGASCVAYALLNGDDETGVTTMLLDEGMDTGPILMQWTEAIKPEDTALTLSARLSELGAKQLVQTLGALEQGNLKPVPQNHELATKASLIKKEQGHVDWNQSNVDIYNCYRAFIPWPGVFSFLEQKRILFSQIKLDEEESSKTPGQLTFSNRRLFVNCGTGRLEILKLKPEGKRVLSAEEFMRGMPQKEGLILK